MQGSMRVVRLTLTLVGFAFPLHDAEAQTIDGMLGPCANLVSLNEPPARGAGAQEAKPAAAKEVKNARPDIAQLFAQLGDEPPRQLVPLRPSTTDDRRRLEVTRLYAVGRALEDRRAWNDAVVVLQEALKLEPDSIAVCRRLCRLYIGAMGRPALAVEYGTQVLRAEPGDSETLEQLVEHFRGLDPAAAVAIVKQVLANPKLGRHEFGRLLAQYELGRLCSGRLHQIEQAADAFSKVVEELDDKSANRFTPLQVLRVLGERPATRYLDFATVFLAAKRDELAVKALERGLIYDENHPQISLILADTLLKLDRPEQALALVERHIERQTSFLEAYDVLARALKALNREKDITPRLEAAVRRDSTNAPLQYVLADHYREVGENDKAEAIYKSLLSSQPTPQTYRALASSLLKRKKATDFLKVIGEAIKRPEGLDAVKSQLAAAAADDDMTNIMLDSGLTQIRGAPKSLSRSSYEVLSLVANNPAQNSQNKTKRLEKLLAIERVFAEENPGAIIQNEIIDTLRQLGRYAESASAFAQLMTHHPATKSIQRLVELADLHRRAGHNEAVKSTLGEAQRLEPDEGSAQVTLAALLSEIGQVEDAVRVLRDAARREPGNPDYDWRLGIILVRYGRNDEAINVLETVLKRFSSNDEIIKVVRPILSIVYVNQGEYAKGEAELERLLERFPEDAEPNNDLGYLYAEQGKQLEKAELMIRKALSVQENPAYLDSLGWVLFKRGRAKDALEPLIKAAGKSKEQAVRDGSNPDATIFEHLGDVYFQLHDLPKAAQSWSEAAKYAEQAVPPEKRLQEIRKKIGSLEQVGSRANGPAVRTP